MNLPCMLPDYLEENCVSNRTIHIGKGDLSLYGFLRPNRQGDYSANMDCSLKIQAPQGYRIVIRFRRIEIYKPYSNCASQDVLYVIGNSSTSKTNFVCGAHARTLASFALG